MFTDFLVVGSRVAWSTGSQVRGLFKAGFKHQNWYFQSVYHWTI